MTALYITIDTEYSFGFASRDNGAGRGENFARSIVCDTPGGPIGIEYQMDVFDACGLKAVFFVDPMPALVWGVEAITDIVAPIVERKHDVQLHLHSEWLEIAGPANPLKGRTGRNIKDFRFEEQCLLLDYARDMLVAAGAPRPVAFRAGNYGANDDTLRALCALGIGYDTSHCPGIAVSECGIGLGTDCRSPVEYLGVIEVPIACIGNRGGGLRHAQITALSAEEMMAGLRHARDCDHASFTLVSHSFELASRDRLRANHLLKRRFERMCEGLAAMQGVATATYSDAPPSVDTRRGQAPPLPYNPWRTGKRMAEQAISNLLYGGR